MSQGAVTNLSIQSLKPIVHRLQDVAVELRVWEAADGQTATTRHQNLQRDAVTRYHPVISLTTACHPEHQLVSILWLFSLTGREKKIKPNKNKDKTKYLRKNKWNNLSMQQEHFTSQDKMWSA